MRLIDRIVISRFRSIKEAVLPGVGDFSALAGLNNSGKSNLLRALNLFFRGEAEPGIPFNLSNDCLRSKAHLKKEIRITVAFKLPQTFKFRKMLEPVEKLLGKSFSITKVWALGESQPRILINDRNVGIEDANEVTKFLNLVSFRYITNRVLPLQVVRMEREALAELLRRRLGHSFKDELQTMQAIESTVSRTLEELDRGIRESCEQIEKVKLSVPPTLRDMISLLGYKFIQGDIEFDDEVQGSGLQSQLMYQTLYLIDTDYSKSFGWRQATIWVVEEPESSLHSSLEAQLAKFLSAIAREPESRLQIITTTHSDLMIQHADVGYLVQNRGNQSEVQKLSLKELLTRSAESGISRWTHPLLYHPLDPLILVEGDYDELFISKGLRLLTGTNYHVACLKTLTQENRGGIAALLGYVRDHSDAIRSRGKDAPVLVVLDWDSKSKEKEFRKGFGSDDPYHVDTWPAEKCNPKLGATFRGIERFYSSRIIKEAIARNARILEDPRQNIYEVGKDDYGTVKRICKDVIEEGLEQEDLEFAKDFLQNIVHTVKQVEDRAGVGGFLPVV